jgi:CelD/BcsL family acetyltransferase involved in cellulose biosynthesis
MHLEALRTLEEIDEIADEWNHLLSVSASHVPFLRYEYLRAWWETRGGGEWPQGELYVVTARGEAGELVGIAPLFFTENLDGDPALMLLGSIEISDYLDVIARPEGLPTFLDALFNFLESPAAPGWKALDWYNVLDASPTLPALKAAAQRCGWLYAEQRLQHCPYIPLPGDWEAYLAGIDKKQRHEVRRKMRRAETGPAPVRWYFVQDEAALEAEVEAFFDLMAQDAEKERFLTPAAALFPGDRGKEGRRVYELRLRRAYLGVQLRPGLWLPRALAGLGAVGLSLAVGERERSKVFRLSTRR